MNTFPSKVHSYIYFSGLGLCAFSLSLSKFLISVSFIILLINWIIEEPFTLRWNRFKNNKPLWCILFVYLIHILGLINTSDFKFAFHDLNLKLLLFVLPIIIGTSEKINSNQIKYILASFIIGVFISSLYSTRQIILAHGDIIAQMSKISPFIFHIRLSIMAVLAISFIPWLILKTNNRYVKILLILLLLWLVIFIFIFKSLTGITILLALAVIAFVYFIANNRIFLVRWFVIVFSITVFFLICSYCLKIYVNNFCPKPQDQSSLSQFTASGNPYKHNITPWLENGNFVDLYICEKEMIKEWNARSSQYINPSASDIELKQTLIRYLTSKNLTKDSVGIAQLTSDDISHIENKISNYIYVNKYSIKPRIYRLIWELYVYYNGANPSGYSVPQRIEFNKTAFRAIKRNFWFGTGTGDVKTELLRQYEMDKSPLLPQVRSGPHNQFVSIMLTFGIFGFIIFLAGFFIPVFITQKYKQYLMIVFMVILILSMFSISTLEKYSGISFVALFYSLFLFSDISIKSSCKENCYEISTEKNPDS